MPLKIFVNICLSLNKGFGKGTSFQCEVIVKLALAISLVNLEKFDCLFLNFVCVRIFIFAIAETRIILI